MEHETKITDMSLLGPFIEERISKGSDINLTVTGDSMYPLFRSRIDTVLLTAPENIKKYDIVFYKRKNGSYILHRILKIKNGQLCIAGDNETVKEFPVNYDQLIGKVKSFTRKGKTHSVNELWYKFYSCMWCIFFPYRYIGMRLIFKIGKLKNKTGRT